MRILSDNGTPAPLRRFLVGHEVSTAAEHGWARLENGTLLQAAEDGGFELLLTTDKNMFYQQNLSGRKIALVVLERQNWPVVRAQVQRIVDAVDASVSGSYVEVPIDWPDRRSE
jgi:hypothetical protein